MKHIHASNLNVCVIIIIFVYVCPVQGLVPDLNPGDVIVPVPVTVDHIATREGAVADDLIMSFIFSIFLSPTHFMTFTLDIFAIAQVKSTLVV